MPSLSRHLERFVSLAEAGESATAMERFYAEDVVVFENRELARAGKQRCIEFERAQRARASRPAKLKALKTACNETTGASFVEWLIRFEGDEGRPMRLEEVAVQTWRGEVIVEERFYYEGAVDEGD
jgi:ketosteroid isomerase-like protein